MNYEEIIKSPASKQLKSGKVTRSSGEEVGKHVTSAREEIIIVLQGQATAILPFETKIISAGQTYYIPPETTHNIVNNTDKELSYIYTVSLFE